MDTLKRERINKILENDDYIRCIHLNEEAEKDRPFCRHNMMHFLDVARIAQILNLREARQIEDEWIYAAALLHDIGRYEQYAQGTPHETASARLARPILHECGFSHMETEAVLKAIKSHRTEAAADRQGLEGVLYRADKLSRSCFACKAEPACDWKESKKNRNLVW